MNKKTLLLLILSALYLNLSSQIKIGKNFKNINPNSLLEMESDSMGMLLPRVNLISTADFSPLKSHVAGMTVYNLSTVNDVRPGYYYNDGTKWFRLASDQNSLIIKRVGCSGTKIQTILDPETPATDGILVSYEDTSGNINGGVVKSRIAGTSVTVEFATAPPSSSFLTYAFPGNGTVIATGPQGAAGPQGLAGTNGSNGSAATIAVGTVTALAPGANPTVTNGGTTDAAILNFGFPATASILKGTQATDGINASFTISNANIASTSVVTVSYRNTVNEIISHAITNITAGSFTVQFAATPSSGGVILYTIVN